MGLVSKNIVHPTLKIGDKIIIGRTEYTIVAEFEDTREDMYIGKPMGTYRTEHLYVGRKLVHNSYYEYSNIIHWINNQWQLRS